MDRDVARTASSRRGREHLCVTLDGHEGPWGRIAGHGIGLGTELFTDDQDRLVALCLDWAGAVDALPSVGLRRALEEAARPGDLVVRRFGTVFTQAFADGADELAVVFEAPAPWDAPIGRWRIVEVGAGVLVGVRSDTAAVAWVSVSAASSD